MWGIGKILKTVGGPVVRAVGGPVVRAVGHELMDSRAGKIGAVVKEGSEALRAIEFLKNKYERVDDDAAWAWKEITEFRDALRDLL